MREQALQLAIQLVQEAQRGAGGAMSAAPQVLGDESVKRFLPVDFQPTDASKIQDGSMSEDEVKKSKRANDNLSNLERILSEGAAWAPTYQQIYTNALGDSIERALQGALGECFLRSLGIKEGRLDKHVGVAAFAAALMAERWVAVQQAAGHGEA